MISARTVVLKDLDLNTTEQKQDKLIRSVHKRNTGIKVNKIIKIPNNGHMMKMIMDTIEMTNKVKQEGVIVGDQRSRPKSIESDIIPLGCIIKFIFRNN